MGKQFNKITWVIKNFSSLQHERIYSDHFVIDGCKWNLLAYPEGNKGDYLSLFLEVANYGSLPIGWRRHAKFSFTIVNQRRENLSRHYDLQQWFDQKAPGWGRTSLFPLSELHVKDNGFLVNNELNIVVEIDVLEVIGKLDVAEEISTRMDTIDDDHGFQYLPSQAKFVSRMFDKHPQILFKLRTKNQNLSKGYMSLLLGLIETICHLPEKMSKNDLNDTYATLGFMKDIGFKLDWLEKKLDEMVEKKEYEEASEIGLQEMEEELKEMKQKCSAMETLVMKEKVIVLAAKAPLSLDDFSNVL